MAAVASVLGSRRGPTPQGRITNSRQPATNPDRAGASPFSSSPPPNPPRRTMANPSLRTLAATASAAAARLAAAASSSSSAAASITAAAAPGVASATAYFPGMYSSEVLLAALQASTASAARRAALHHVARRAALHHIARRGIVIDSEGLVGASFPYQRAMEAALEEEEEELRFPCASAACESGAASPSTAPCSLPPSSSDVFFIYAAELLRSALGPTSAAAATQGARAFAPLIRSSPAPTSTAGQAAASMYTLLKATTPSLARGYATNHDEAADWNVDDLINRMNSIQLKSDDEMRFRIAFHKKFYPYWKAVHVCEHLRYQDYPVDDWVLILKVVYPKLGPHQEAVHVLIKEDLKWCKPKEGSDPNLHLILVTLDSIIKKQGEHGKTLKELKEAADKKFDFSKVMTFITAVANFFGL